MAPCWPLLAIAEVVVAVVVVVQVVLGVVVAGVVALVDDDEADEDGS